MTSKSYTVNIFYRKAVEALPKLSIEELDAFERNVLRPGTKCQYISDGLLNAVIIERELVNNMLTLTLKVTSIDIPFGGGGFGRGSVFEVSKDLTQTGLPKWRVAPPKTFIGIVGL